MFFFSHPLRLTRRPAHPRDGQKGRPPGEGSRGNRSGLVHWIPAFRGNDERCLLTASQPHCEILKKEGQVLAQQNILVEQDLAARDLPVCPGRRNRSSRLPTRMSV